MFETILASTITSADMTSIVKPIKDVCDVVIPVLLTLVGSIGAIYCIFLGIKYAKADDPQEHDKAKKALKNAIIGFVLIFVLLVMLSVGTNIFIDFYNKGVANS